MTMQSFLVSKVLGIFLVDKRKYTYRAPIIKIYRNKQNLEHHRGTTIC